jgi:hypothetical protein
MRLEEENWHLLSYDSTHISAKFTAYIKHWFVLTVTRLLPYEIGHKISLQGIYSAFIFNPIETKSRLILQASHYFSKRPRAITEAFITS